MPHETGGPAYNGTGTVPSFVWVSAIAPSFQSFGMVCAPASANFLRTFTDQHSAEYSRGTLCRLAIPCAALLPKFTFCWLSLPCSPWLLAASALLGSAWAPTPAPPPGNSPKARSPAVVGLTSWFSFCDGSPNCQMFFYFLDISGMRVNLFPIASFWRHVRHLHTEI